MNPINRDEIPTNIRAEAAAWLARLRSDEVRPEDQVGFRAWLCEDDRHEDVFEQVTSAWEMAGGVAGPRQGQGLQAISRRALVLAGPSALIVAAAAGFYSLTASDTYTTQTGEQRRIALADGSTVTLDTDTRIEVAYQRKQRLVELTRGRAHFQVATDRHRPFVVRAGDRQVVALGTAFDVSQLRDETAVLLVEGRVRVQAARAAQFAASRTLSPGERVIFQEERMIAQDRPNLVKATAWQTGRVAFDSEPLSEAVVEMNRYSQRPLVIADRALGAVRISGIYNASDTEGFARSVSVLLPASVQMMPDAIILGVAEPSMQNPI